MEVEGKEANGRLCSYMNRRLEEELVWTVLCYIVASSSPGRQLEQHMFGLLLSFYHDETTKWMAGDGNQMVVVS
jgi:hypothetical protein